MTKLTGYRPHAAPEFEADELLSCPCCGGDPKLEFQGNPHTKSIRVIIKCKKCRLQRVDATLRGDAEWIAKHAISDWNKRTKIKQLEEEKANGWDAGSNSEPLNNPTQVLMDRIKQLEKEKKEIKELLELERLHRSNGKPF